MARFLRTVIAGFLLLCVLCGCAARQSTSVSASPEELAEARKLEAWAGTTLEGLLERDKQGVLAGLLHRAQGVMVFPELVNVGFFFSVGGGSGVAMARDGERWTGPFFVTLRQGGYGVQAGLEKVAGVLLIMDRAVLEDVLDNGAALRGQASVTALDATWLTRTPPFEPGGNVVFLSDGVGLYAGVALSGTDVGHRDRYNNAWWTETDWRMILTQWAPEPAAQSGLVGLLENRANKKANP